MTANVRVTFMSMICGNWLSQIIYVLAKNKIADHLSTVSGISLIELAAGTSTHPEVLSGLMEIACEKNVFEKKRVYLFNIYRVIAKK